MDHWKGLVARALALGAAVALLPALSEVDASASPGCPSVGKAWAAPGPFAVAETPSGAGHTLFHPARLGGCRTYPVLLWGNGSGSTPETYAGLLRHLASHGFIVVAADTGAAGSGREMLAGLDHVTAEHHRPGSVFRGRVALDRVGGTGHSQGGAGAIVTGADPRVDTVVPIQPGPFSDHRLLHGPAFYLAGQLDLVASPLLLVHPRYRESGHVPAVYGELAGAGHTEPTGNGGGYRGPVTAWFRFHLLGDEQARGVFFGPDCTSCAAPEWSRFERNARAQAVPGGR
ncbi:chlorophyllase-like protein [Lentzea atacamensis]|uniref:Chlorophyllase-like protein n=1 Tax=Lentzea atacamensis TaxID=531938 RepID=A0A316HWB2_9PSEU|nr:acetylxylan esterase [Lentzea atacamensis]PWK84944.1 chlorophyllase-like protein [Lentzea atacamensis]